MIKSKKILVNIKYRAYNKTPFIENQQIQKLYQNDYQVIKKKILPFFETNVQISVKNIIWVLFEKLKIFQNNDFIVYFIYNKNHKLLHHSFVFPKFFKFPFMNNYDLQVGDIWTQPAERGKGLAQLVLKQIIQDNKSRSIWYIVSEDNIPSINLAEKLGFKFSKYLTKKGIIGIYK